LIVLGQVVVEAVRTGQPGRGTRASREEIVERLVAADVDVSDEQLSDIITRLVDVKQLEPTRKAFGYPIVYTVGSHSWQFDPLDLLCSEICRILRQHDEGFIDPQQVKDWLIADGVEFDDRSFASALAHLGSPQLGRLRQPAANEWSQPGERPTWFVEPKVFDG
jgi:hypothetical protein